MQDLPPTTKLGALTPEQLAQFCDAINDGDTNFRFELEEGRFLLLAYPGRCEIPFHPDRTVDEVWKLMDSIVAAKSPGPNLLGLCRAAIAHTLNAIASDPAKYYLIGGKFSGTGSKLAQAYAALTGWPVEKVYTDFAPREEEYERWNDEREANQRLLEYCREHGINGHD